MLKPEFSTMVGKLLLAIDPPNTSKAEAMFQEALESAHRHQEKMFELRAATSLCRLWQIQGKADQGKELLRGVYEQFTEGFDTPDLREAKELL